jgi:hypothetical protein
LARNGTWKATISDNGEKLSIVVPMLTMDDRANLPGLTQILLELTSGEKALDTNDLAQEVATLRAEVERLKASPAA